MSVLEMIDKITNARDSNAFSIGIFINLSKAFDTLNHNILFDKLEHYSVRGVTLQWFKSFCTTDHIMLFIIACNRQSWELNAASHKALY